jgi:hypothetical protein
VRVRSKIRIIHFVKKTTFASFAPRIPNILKRFVLLLLGLSMFIPISNFLTFPLLVSDSNAIKIGFQSDQKLFSNPLKLRNSSLKLLPESYSHKDSLNLINASTQKTINEVHKIVNLVYESTYHCPYDAPQSILHYFAQLLSPSQFKEEGLLDFRYFQCGICHQRNFLLNEILRSQGFATNLLGINGHVVVTIEINEFNYFVDSDFGIGPFPIEERFNKAFIVDQYQDIVDSKSELEKIIFAYTIKEDDGNYELTRLRQIQESQINFFNIFNFFLTLGTLLVFSLLFRMIVLKVKELRQKQKMKDPSK